MSTKLKNLAIVLMALALGPKAAAQHEQKVKNVVLRTGTTIAYDRDAQDSARVILTPEGDSLGIKVYIGAGVSEDYLYTQISRVEFWPTAEVSDSTNTNRNDAADLVRNGEGWRLEFPRFYHGTDTTFEVTHRTDDYGITYSLEWDGTKKANRWTCYELYEGNMQKNTKRQDGFVEDPSLPAPYRTKSSDYTGSGYTRGHLCPSGDRLCSAAQNKQTFYMSNMQPQLSAHNSGVWAMLESKVRNVWAPASGSGDTLYVVKAATIDEANIMGYTKAGLIVPKVFYMALLYYDKAADGYQAIGIWSPHAGDSTTEYLTIDELERRTGIDFFCNLPDGTEATVQRRIGGRFK